jgi:cell division protein FtsI/penicillin-binding protein 2
MARYTFRTKGAHRRPRLTEQRDPFFRATARRRRRWPLVLAAVAVAGALLAGALVWQAQRSAASRSRAALEHTVEGFLAAWERSDWAVMRRLTQTPPKTFASTYKQMRSALHVMEVELTPGAITERGSTATAAFTARLALTGLGPWTYRGRLDLARRGEAWRVQWTPASVHPALKAKASFSRTRSWEDRAPILDRHGEALTLQGDVVTIGVVPGQIENRQQVLNALNRYTGVEPDRVEAALDAPGVQPDWFVPVITLRMQRYLEVRPQLYPVPGIYFRRGRGRILLMEGFAQQVVGRVGEVTAEQLEELGQPYQVGDVVGRFGLEHAFERQLAGLPSGSVRLVRGDRVVKSLHEFAGQDPEPLRTTLDVDTQRAAEDALRDVGGPAALVAVDGRSGEIRAVANRPTDGANTAMDGHYPPGSTFKIVTAAAALAGGKKLQSPVTCPPNVNAGGKVFRNFEGESLGQTTVAQAFAHSCNTAFIQLALDLPDESVPEMARTFGFGQGFSLPVPVASTQFPRPADDAERAAAAIGQGRVLATPLSMATVAAAAATGTWRPPSLLPDVPAGQAHPLPKKVAPGLREMMRLVVTEGTGTAANVGGPVGGKTGTAEFGSTDETHAWFVGFRGTLAFSVFVQAGGVGGQVAAPLAAKFLRAL